MAAAIRAVFPHCKIVAATGMMPDTAKLADVDLVLGKPFKITLLHETVVTLTGGE